MRAPKAFSVVACLFAFAACSGEDIEKITPDGGTTPTDSGTPVATDSGAGSDASTPLPPPPRSDASTPDDAGTAPQGPWCAELEACCPESGFFRGRCEMTVDANSEDGCQSDLESFRSDDICTEPTDAGTPPNTAPECAELDACCDEASAFLRTQCEDAVDSNDPQDCTDMYSRMQGNGFCEEGSTDAGTPAPDAGSGGLGPICSDLATCCPKLGFLAQAACQGAIRLGDEFGCSVIWDQNEDTCDPGPVLGRACEEAQQCCANIQSSVWRQRCEDGVAAADESECRTVITVVPECQEPADAGSPPPPPADAGTPPADAGAPSLGPRCTEAAECCPNIQSQVWRDRCLDGVAAADEGECRTVTIVVPECSMPPPAPDAGVTPDAGEASDAGAPPAFGPNCEELSECCLSLDDQDQAACFEATTNGDELECNRQLVLNASTCNAAPPPLGFRCEQAEQCCPNIQSQTWRNRCYAGVATADEAECRTVMIVVPECSMPPPADAGTPQTNCEALSDCCADHNAPEICDQVVASGGEATCLTFLLARPDVCETP